MRQMTFILILIVRIFLFDAYALENVKQDGTDTLLLDTILHKCAEYCEKLENSGFDLSCEENIIEKSDYTLNLDRFENDAPESWEMENHYSYTFRFKKTKAGYYEENRIQHKERIKEMVNGQKAAKIVRAETVKNAVLKTEFSISPNPLLLPLEFLTRERQKQYLYKIVDKTKHKGRPVVIIEIYPKNSTLTSDDRPRIWIGAKIFSIVKIEIPRGYISGLTICLKRANAYGAALTLKGVVEYDKSEHGLYLPVKSEIIEIYKGGEIVNSWFKNKNYRRSEIAIRYDHYRFADIDVSGTKPLNQDRLLKSILVKAAAYCDKLEKEALHYYCKEIIYETHLPFQDKPSNVLIKKVNKYVYDYQIVKIGDKIKERRILINDNGKKVFIENAPVKANYFYSYNSFFGPVGFASKKWQPYYRYKIVKRFKKKGEKVVVLHAAPKKSIRKKPNFGDFWIRERDGAVLRIEIAQESLAGYDNLLKIALKYMAKLQVRVVHEYKESRHGLLYPSQTEFTESYIGGLYLHKSIYKGKYVRNRTVFKFRDYKFFMVDTQTIEEN